MPSQPAGPVRCAIVPPVPVPYREPLFTRLAERAQIVPRVIYQSAAQADWDQPAEWFPARHGYDAVVLKSLQRGRPGRSPLLLPRALGAELGRFDPGCVVSWEFGAATLRALAWCRRRGRALVVFSEVTEAGDAELTALQRLVHRRVASRADGFIAASSAARRRLTGLGVARERIEVALQSSALESAAPNRSAADARDGGPVRVLNVGRLVPDKNVALLIEAFAAAGFDAGEAELEICGTGPLEGELEELARRLGVAVRFRGFLAQDSLADAYANAHVLALVSTYEPFGVAVREAATAGLPVVCARTAGAAGDLAVDGENAVLVDPQSRDDVAEALRRLVRDSALRERMAARSRAIADSHPPEDDVAAWERAVLRAVAER